MATTTVDLQIIPLHNCTKCIRKVEKTLCRFDGVKLLDVDSENGKFTIETTRHPEEIRDALQRKFAGKSVFLSRRINHSNPSSVLINPRNSSIQGPPNFHDMAEALVTVSRTNGLQTLEYTQSSTIKISFDNQPSEPTTSGSAANVPPPPPPPRQYQPTTSGSACADENVYGGACNEDFGYGYAPPPPPRTITRSSAPLMPTAQAQGYVYGYPTELYRDDDSRGCCTIL